MNKLTHLSLFAGIGGIDLAAEWAGFQTIAFCEIDPYCQKVLKKHWPKVPIIGDIRDVKGEEYQPVTLITGGFPCQDVSTAGLRGGIKEGTRSGLWSEYVRIIDEIRPRWVLVENVRGLLSIDDGRGFREILRDIANLGYDAEWCVLRASQFGARHQRERVFIIAYPNSIGWFEKPILQRINNKITRQWTQRQLDVLDYFQGLIDICPQDLRGNDGLSDRLDDKQRVKACGNAVVPYQVYPILKAIADIENNGAN